MFFELSHSIVVLIVQSWKENVRPSLGLQNIKHSCKGNNNDKHSIYAKYKYVILSSLSDFLSFPILCDL